ncbi:endonuclease/exonuclease/phosphatase family metal-dependent hydrolase [Aeromicrobium panaciterrae]|uniref:Endonuclease/exonuclease/phosphatase family metal-dependent hydrolase n=1 Tax=Aeromicrobium panaciterrae TaxID=363861 RepID=A0ABU1UN01_9ACTN|nr:endonuclease/exonuclease/phosphatase family protein [Aeromicrobium panaciterrae]MDR7086542.1 endonuclease/exonuclease/phosphatase family metal-dependent hydrolase [Aeromicrobium panaciterrae]
MRRSNRTPQIAGGVVLAIVLLSSIWWIPKILDSGPPSPNDVRVVSESTSAEALWDRGLAEAFRVQYSKKVDFSDAKTEKVTRNRLSLRALIPGTTYFLRVVAIDDKGDASDPSRLVRFTTAFPYKAPKLSLPNAKSTNVTARWTSGVKKARFEAQIDNSEKFSSPVVVPTTKRQKKLATLEPNTSYAVRVRVVSKDGGPLSAWSKTLQSTTAAYEPMGVGTYNVLKWRKGNWSARRAAVVDLIKDSHLDVVGLQEAVPSYTPGGPPQYQDIVNHLGSDWAVTRSNKKGPTGETRTVYNTTKLKQVAEGYQALAGSSRFRGTTRYLAWSVFEQRSTGKQFIFANTHLTPGTSGSVRAQHASEARQIVAALKAVNTHHLPVILVGDFNSGGSRTKSNSIYGTITGAGYIDPLVQSKKLGMAEKVVDGNLTTSNGLNRTAPRRSNPAFLDHIFVSRMRVSQFQVVAKLDSAGRFIGTIPSDHNLVRATVYLP